MERGWDWYRVERWIGQDAGPGPEWSITLVAAVGWLGGLIFLDSFRLSFLFEEMVRGHRACWVQPSWHWEGRVFCACVCSCETQQLWHSSLQGGSGEETRCYMTRWLQWPHSTHCPPLIQHLVFSSGKWVRNAHLCQASLMIQMLYTSPRTPVFVEQ